MTANHLHNGEEMSLYVSKVDENGTWGIAFSPNMTPPAFVTVSSMAIHLLYESGESQDWDYFLCQLPNLLGGALAVLCPGIEARTQYRNIEYRIRPHDRSPNWDVSPMALDFDAHDFVATESDLIASGMFSPAKEDQKVQITIGPSKR